MQSYFPALQIVISLMTFTAVITGLITTRSHFRILPLHCLYRTL